MEIKLIDSFSDFLGLEPVWNDVLARSTSDEVCLTFEWLKAWWTAFGSGNTLCVLVVKKDGRIIALAPLMRSKGSFLGAAFGEIRFIGNDNSPRSDFIVCENGRAVIEEVLVFLTSQKHWSVINLQNIAMDSPNYQYLLEAARKRRFICGIKSGLRSPYIKIEGGEWGAYLKNRSKRFRKSLRSSANHVKNAGKAEFVSFEQAPDNRLLHTVFEISDKCWKARYKGHIGSCEGNKIFFNELTRLASEKRWLLLWMLAVNERPVAYEYHLRYKGTAYALRADFHQDFASISPGAVLNMHIIEQYFKSRFLVYDMCGHEDAYKKNWTKDIRCHAIVMVYNTTPAGRLLYFSEFKCIHPLKMFLNSLRLVRRVKRILLGRY